jgi:hypothetical protein
MLCQIFLPLNFCTTLSKINPVIADILKCTLQRRNVAQYVERVVLEAQQGWNALISTDFKEVVFLADAGQLGGWIIVFDTQPAQFPGLNLCDLCFFNLALSLSARRRWMKHTSSRLSPRSGKTNKRQRAREAACNVVVPMATFLIATEALDKLLNPLVA